MGNRAAFLWAGLMAATVGLAAACGGGAAPAATTPPTTPSGPIAGRVPPHAFVGTVTVDGAPAADGTVVTAWLEGVPGPAAEGTVSKGSYNIKIVQRTSAPYANKKIAFKVGGRDARQTAVWEQGGADEVNLVVTAVAPPTGGTAGGLDITTAGEDLKFDKAKLTAKAGAPVVLTFKNGSTVLQHNWVLVKAGAKDEVATAGTAAGPAASWIPAGDPRIIIHTGLLDPGKSQELRFTAPAAGTYQYVCTFPAHNFTMFGEFTVTP